MTEKNALSDEMLDKISGGGSKDTGNCPQCHQADLSELFGCKKCPRCGYVEYDW